MNLMITSKKTKKVEMKDLMIMKSGLNLSLKIKIFSLSLMNNTKWLNVNMDLYYLIFQRILWVLNHGTWNLFFKIPVEQNLVQLHWKMDLKHSSLYQNQLEFELKEEDIKKLNAGGLVCNKFLGEINTSFDINYYKHVHFVCFLFQIIH